jgi:hypothetical protein
MRLPALVVFLALCSCGSTASSSKCDVLACAGCCDVMGVCQLGTSSSSCGYQVTCDVCQSGETCISRHCAVCGPANCSGCCTSDGRCVSDPRERETNCGFNGGACADCMAAGKTCDATALTCK